jgi:uncharacterized protein YjbI with pentapeptide repeats
VVVEDADWANVRRPGLFGVSRVVLRRCRLTGAELSESAFIDVTFAECRLDLVGLRMARLQRVAFEQCRMSECDLYGASLTDVVFDGCDLRRATLSGSKLARVELRGCELDGVRGAEALRGARLRWADVIHNAGFLAGALGIEVID